MNEIIKIENYKEVNKGKYFPPRRHIPEEEMQVKYFLIPQDKGDSDFYGRKLTFQIIHKNTKNLQENIQMLVDFLNEEWNLTGENQIIGNSVGNGKESYNIRLWTKTTRLIFDLIEAKGKYDKDFFLEEVRKIVSLENKEKTISENPINSSPSIEKISSIKHSENAGIVEAISLNDSDFSSIEEILDSTPIYEGAKKTIIIDAYERNPKARKKCIEHYGTKCFVCSFDFNKFYGEEVAQNYIHVHHLTPIHEIGEEYEVNPIEDLRPVCPNCHAMIHRKNPPYTIEEIKEFIQNQTQ